MSEWKALREAIAVLKAMGLRVPMHRVFKSELPLCGARCRDGHPCQAKAAWDASRHAPRNGRCRIHGGLSTGPRTQEGRDRLSAAMRKRWAERREELRARISQDPMTRDPGSGYGGIGCVLYRRDGSWIDVSPEESLRLIASGDYADSPAGPWKDVPARPCTRCASSATTGTAPGGL
ncbi:MAG: HGGxSTG domain-containing protein [Gammaproteobacteria bacterium]